ncbi:polysaccharide deacetylase family protein [Ketobacter sp.]|uniref:polysaccharide deacetylase family protein n=1 Tax=Ketobacter sp. TaxID=2083498 RepID=UPI000F231A42|nr:MAG: DUF2334 domain-containing protein [Ketobacter sp.]
MNNARLQALISIHDVMPETRPLVSDMLYQLSRLERLQPDKITLLIVPGKDWQPTDIHWLQALAQQGHPLAGHGWSHRAPTPRSLYHWCHRLLLSRTAAEHLSRSETDLRQRVQHCFAWFQQQDLPTPDLYVPPAWANGNLNWLQWPQRPFRLLETLPGVMDLEQGLEQRLPLTGYEADTTLRAWFLNAYNQHNLYQARHQQRPLRIGLHPYDLRYPLAPKALQHIAQVTEFLSYTDLFPRPLPALCL